MSFPEKIKSDLLKLSKYQFKIEGATRFMLGLYLLIGYIILETLNYFDKLTTSYVLYFILIFAVVAKFSEYISKKTDNKLIQTITDIIIPYVLTSIFVFAFVSFFVTANKFLQTSTTDNLTVNRVILLILLLVSIVFIIDGLIRLTYTNKKLSELKTKFRVINILIYLIYFYCLLSYLHINYTLSGSQEILHAIFILFFIAYIVENNFETWESGHAIIDISTLGLQDEESNYYIMTSYDYSLYEQVKFKFQNQAKFPVFLSGGFGTMNSIGNIHIGVITFINKLSDRK